MNAISQQFADYVVGLRYEDIPAPVIAVTKERVMDILGACFSGCSQSSLARKLYTVVSALNDSGQASILGTTLTTSMPMAALCNAAMAHALELDDGHRYAGVHAGCVAVSVALAVGEHTNCSGKKLMEAIIASYEITYRIAKNVVPSHIKKGFHPTGCTAVFGAAAAAGKLLGLTSAQLTHAFGLAGLKSAGIMEIVTSGQSGKGLLPGHAAHEGIFCALLAQAGVEGPLHILEGKNGFLHTMAEDVDPSTLVEGLGQSYEILDSYTKLYPTCRHMHQPAENIMALRETYGLDYHKVRSIVCRVSKVAYTLSGQIFQPKNTNEARFSMACAVALAFKYGDINLTLLEKAITDEDIISLEQKVIVLVDDYVESLLPKTRCAVVEVTMEDGTVYRKEGTVLRGSPDAPVSIQVLAGKLRGCAEAILPKEKIDAAVCQVMNLEELDQVSQLIQHLVL